MRGGQRYGSAVPVAYSDPGPASVSEVSDRGRVMKEAMRREAIDSLSQQLQAERREQAGIGQAETISALLVTTLLGVALFSAVTGGKKR